MIIDSRNNLSPLQSFVLISINSVILLCVYFQLRFIHLGPDDTSNYCDECLSIPSTLLVRLSPYLDLSQEPVSLVGSFSRFFPNTKKKRDPTSLNI